MQTNPAVEQSKNER